MDSNDQVTAVAGPSRRRFLVFAALGSALNSAINACASVGKRLLGSQRTDAEKALSGSPKEVCDVVVIGSGFGGTLSALTLANHFRSLSAGGQPKGRVVMLERGGWWTTPFDTVQDPTVAAYDTLVKKNQPVQRWASAENFRGLFDVLTRCVRSKQHPRGLLDITQFNKAPDGEVNPRLSVITSNGVGGGSLIYQNVTIQPPAAVLKELPVQWTSVDGKTADEWFALARRAISQSVLAAWDSDPKKAVNTGLSRIVARTAGLDPHFGAGGRRFDKSQAAASKVWMNRPRLFQSAAEGLSSKPEFADIDWGAVDLSINDIGPKLDPTDPKFDSNSPTNHCERQGRCMIGCLPGARHTLNKQLMRALWPAPNGAPPQINDKSNHLEVRAAAEVLYIEPVAPPSGDRGRYRIVYRQDGTLRAIEADRVIIAAGTLGTSSLLLRSKLPEEKGGYGTLPGLSGTLGSRFTNNGDFLAFLENVKEPVNMFRGPNATSFIHVKPNDKDQFHTLEDAGLPNIFSSLFSKEPGPNRGSAFIRKATKEGLTPAIVAGAVGSALLQDIKNGIDRLLNPKEVDESAFGAEALAAQRVMGIAGIGRDAACGQFTLDDDGQLTLHRTDKKAFDADPSVSRIRQTIQALAGVLGAKAYSPYDDKEPASLGSLHPLGGCPIGATVDNGVVDELGEVHGYRQLYVADGSIVGQSLGVNPSLTISAISLRIAKNIVNGITVDQLRPTTLVSGI